MTNPHRQNNIPDKSFYRKTCPISHMRIQLSHFHSALQNFVASGDSDSGIPLVCIVSDSGLKGEDPECDFSTRYGGQLNKDVNVRSVIPPAVFNSVYFREIRWVSMYMYFHISRHYLFYSFNPIAPTIMTKVLTALVSKQYDRSTSSSLRTGPKTFRKPKKEDIQLLVDSSNGDIRSAIMALQFTTSVQSSKGNKGNARLM